MLQCCNFRPSNNEFQIDDVKVVIGDLIRQSEHSKIHQGCFGETLVNVKIVKMTKTSKKFPESHLGKLIAHPRFLRYLGTCLNPISLDEINIVSDFYVGATMEVRTI